MLSAVFGAVDAVPLRAGCFLNRGLYESGAKALGVRWKNHHLTLLVIFVFMNETAQPGTNAASSSTSQRPRRRMPWWQKIAIAVAGLTLLIILLLAAGAGVLYYLWSAPPAHWQRHQTWLQTTSIEERKVLATTLEKRLLQQLSKVPLPPRQAHNAATAAPASPPVDFSMSIDEANAWLEQRLPEVLANQHLQLPDNIQGLMIAVEGQTLLLSFQYQSAKIDQVFTLETQPAFVIGADGVPKLDFNLQSLRGGRMRIPQGLLDRATQQVEQQGVDKAVESVMATLRGRAIDATVPYPGDASRSVRITDIDLKQAALDLKARVEAKTK